MDQRRDKMPTPNGFGEINPETGNSLDNMSIGDHVVQEGYEGAGDKAVLALLEQNDKLVQKYSEQLCNHFSGVLENLPAAMQQSLIDSIRMYTGKHDVVYQGMVERYDARVLNA